MPGQVLEHRVAQVLAFLAQVLPDGVGVDPEWANDDAGGDGGLDDLLLLQVHLNLLLHLQGRVRLYLVLPGRNMDN